MALRLRKAIIARSSGLFMRCLALWAAAPCCFSLHLQVLGEAPLRNIAAVSPPRPAWMKVPPAWVQEPMPNAASGSDVQIRLASYGRGESFVAKLKRLEEAAKKTSFFDEILLWTDSNLQHDELFQLNAEAMMTLDETQLHSRHRPYCGAFKAIVLLRALRNSREGDYVLWTDASKYYELTFKIDPRSAVARLRGQRTTRRPQALPKNSTWRHTNLVKNGTVLATNLNVGSVYGALHCDAACDGGGPGTFGGLFLPQTQFIKRGTLGDYAELIRDETDFFKHQPHLLTSSLFLENTPENRLLVWDWLQMALARPALACGFKDEDQSTLTILAANRSLPLVNPCVYMTRDSVSEGRSGGLRHLSKKDPLGRSKCFDEEKNTDFLLNAVATGAYEAFSLDDWAAVYRTWERPKKWWKTKRSTTNKTNVANAMSTTKRS